MAAAPISNRKLLAAGAGIGIGLLGRELIGHRRRADLSGQVALITGGSRGLGFSLAREFAREGRRLALCARDEPELNRARAALEGQAPRYSRHHAMCPTAFRWNI
jgi:FlaA1/EpsC-like NDP-sugar epimerase